MNNRNSSQDFAIKKEFIDLQLDLRKFMDESELFTLQDILKDPLVVHTLDDYANAYRETRDIKKIQRTLKKLLKYKKKNVNLFPALHSLREDYRPERMIVDEKKEEAPAEEPLFQNSFTFAEGFFSMKQLQPKEGLTKEVMLHLFKTQFRRIEPIKKIQIPKIAVSRTFSVSSSHSQLLKKIEKGAELPNSSQKNSNEIIANSAFRNGILRNVAMMDKSSKTPNSPRLSVPMHTTPQTSVVRATRSPYQNNRNQNPHEALLPSPKNKSENKNFDGSGARKS